MNRTVAPEEDRLDRKVLEACAPGNGLFFQVHIVDRYFLPAVLGYHLPKYQQRITERKDGKRRNRTIHDQISAGLS